MAVNSALSRALASYGRGGTSSRAYSRSVGKYAGTKASSPYQGGSLNSAFRSASAPVSGRPSRRSGVITRELGG